MLDTKDRERKLKPVVAGRNGKFRHIVTVIIWKRQRFKNGAPVSWRLHLQKSVTLSSTEEEEYAAASETAAEMMFVKNTLKLIEIDLDDKMELFVDNAGAISYKE